MASVSHSSVAFSGTSMASDLLRSSSNGVSRVPLKALERARFGMRRRDPRRYCCLPRGEKGEDHYVLEITIYKKVCIKENLDKCSVEPNIPFLIQKKMVSTTSDSTTMRCVVVTGASKGNGLEIR